MDVARINFSHGSHAEHEKVIGRIRKLSQKLDKPVAILGDLQGPKIRVGKLKNGRVTLRKGDEVELTNKRIEGSARLIPVDYRHLVREVSSGEIILLDEGMIRLKVTSVKRDSVFAGAMFGMGQCKLAQGSLEQAYSFFQRTYLLFKAFDGGDWAAKGYIAAANVLSKLEREEDAVSTLKVMLEDRYVNTHPLADSARQQLEMLESPE
jgi:hypothetical protein